MTEHHSVKDVKVKLSDFQLDKLKSATKITTAVIQRLSAAMIGR